MYHRKCQGQNEKSENIAFSQCYQILTSSGINPIVTDVWENEAIHSWNPAGCRFNLLCYLLGFILGLGTWQQADEN